MFNAIGNAPFFYELVKGILETIYLAQKTSR